MKDTLLKPSSHCILTQYFNCLFNCQLSISGRSIPPRCSYLEFYIRPELFNGIEIRVAFGKKDVINHGIWFKYIIKYKPRGIKPVWFEKCLFLSEWPGSPLSNHWIRLLWKPISSSAQITLTSWLHSRNSTELKWISSGFTVNEWVVKDEMDTLTRVFETSNFYCVNNVLDEFFPLPCALSWTNTSLSKDLR